MLTIFSSLRQNKVKNVKEERVYFWLAVSVGSSRDPCIHLLRVRGAEWSAGKQRQAGTGCGLPAQGSWKQRHVGGGRTRTLQGLAPRAGFLPRLQFLKVRPPLKAVETEP